mmetsp:Transcript_7183/g.14433  ORF Transcript_7183/g.14433 Transcript_7183/m.14433 type:complete len:212 (-) Transcript_7183:633-1268(-)
MRFSRVLLLRRSRASLHLSISCAAALQYLVGRVVRSPPRLFAHDLFLTETTIWEVAVVAARRHEHSHRRQSCFLLRRKAQTRRMVLKQIVVPEVDGSNCQKHRMRGRVGRCTIILRAISKRQAQEVKTLSFRDERRPRNRCQQAQLDSQSLNALVALSTIAVLVPHVTGHLDQSFGKPLKDLLKFRDFRLTHCPSVASRCFVGCHALVHSR